MLMGWNPYEEVKVDTDIQKLEQKVTGCLVGKKDVKRKM